MSKHLFPTKILFIIGLMLLQTTAWSDDFRDVMTKKNVVEFSIADIFLEQNFTDGDVEVVIFAKGGDEGMRKFWLLAPDGKVVYSFKAPKDGRNIGAREIVVESPEPPDLNLVLAAYPEGTYTYIGKTFSGQWLYSTADLVHTLPDPAIITFPAADATVSRFDLVISWEPVAGAASYLVELKDEATEWAWRSRYPAIRRLSGRRKNGWSLTPNIR